MADVIRRYLQGKKSTGLARGMIGVTDVCHPKRDSLALHITAGSKVSGRIQQVTIQIPDNIPIWGRAQNILCMHLTPISAQSDHSSHILT